MYFTIVYPLKRMQVRFGKRNTLKCRVEKKFGRKQSNDKFKYSWSEDIHCFIRRKQVGFPIQSAFESFNFTAIVNLPSSTKVVAITELDCLLGLLLDQTTRTRFKLAIQVPTGSVFLGPRIEGGSFSTAFVLQISLHLPVLVAACLFIGGKRIWCPIKRARERFTRTSRLDCSTAFSAATTSFIATVVIARHPAEVGESGPRTASAVLHCTVAINAAGKKLCKVEDHAVEIPFSFYVRDYHRLKFLLHLYTSEVAKLGHNV